MRFVGQDGILRPIGNRPVRAFFALLARGAPSPLLVRGAATHRKAYYQSSARCHLALQT
jgi:hypothetical protein